MDLSPFLLVPRNATVLAAHALLAFIALRKLWTQTAAGLIWRIVWSLIAVGLPFIGPLLFLCLGTLAPRRIVTWRSRPPVVGPGFANRLAAAITEPSPGLKKKFEIEELKAAAAEGDAESLTDLAAMYLAGGDLPQDFGKALQCYEAAALQGYERAQVCLADMYATGLGVPQNDREAYFWYALANPGLWTVRRYQREVMRRIPYKERLAIDARAKQWRPEAKATGIPLPPVNPIEE